MGQSSIRWHATMALFKSADPEATLSKSIAEERTLRGQLEVRLVSARKTATDCQIAARNATRTLADDKIDALEQKEIAAERRVANLSSEIADSDSRLAELETQLAVAADQRIRKATAREIEIIAEGFTAAAANTITALAALVKQTEKMILFLPDAQGLHLFASRVQGELPSNIEMLTGLIRSHTNAVLNGGAQATLPQPAPAPALLPKAAPVVQVCVIKEGVAWLDSNGAAQIAARGTDINLPPSLAEHAIKIGACCSMSDGRRRTIKQNYGTKVGRPLLRNCVKLNDVVDDEPEPFREPVLRSVPPATIDPRFQPIDRGPGFQMQVARSDLDRIASRNQGEDDK
jgi:hypothetical protein